jgi:hypothetical protein
MARVIRRSEYQQIADSCPQAVDSRQQAAGSRQETLNICSTAAGNLHNMVQVNRQLCHDFVCAGCQ